jgi:Ca-activated chloride channel family protein
MGWASFLAGMIAVLAVLALLRRWLALRELALATAAPIVLLVRRPVQVLKALAITLAAGFLALAVLGPQWGHAPPESPMANGRDVLIILDVSRSMLAEDVTPSRLERAKADILDLAASLERQGGMRIGLIAFADRATLLCPFTSDYRCFEEELRRASVETIRLRGDVGGDDGTQLGSALRRAASALDHKEAEFTDVLVLSDGGDMELDTLEATDELARLQVPVYTIGIGDPTHGSPIPIKGPHGTKTYLQYRGETVLTKLEEGVLREVAERTHGRYIGAGVAFLELDQVYARLETERPTREIQAGNRAPLWIHRFQWFLMPAIVLLMVDLLLREARRSAPHVTKERTYFSWAKRRRTGVTVDRSPAVP